jgi:cation:H+ antiporter
MLLGGLVGVVVCAKVFLNGAVGAAQRFGIPEFIVGSIIVAIGTSAPELAINVAASLQSAGDVIASNIVGSNIVNLGLGIGLAGLLVKYQSPSKAYVKAAIIGLVGTLFLFCVTLFSGPSPDVAAFTRTVAVVLFTGFVCFTIWSLRNSDDQGDDDEDMSGVSNSMLVIIPCLIIGAVGMSFFANITVTNAVGVATALGIPDAVIGATIIAAGGSLPEVISCIEAARMKRSNIVIGNIVGSQIFNILGILGLSGLVASFDYSRGIAVDVGFLLVMTLIWLASFKFAAVRRVVGPVLVGTYVLYAIYLVRLAVAG